jgi:hypothetical protein
MKIILICKLVTARLLYTFCARQLGAYFNKATILQYGDKRAISEIFANLTERIVIYYYYNFEYVVQARHS